MSTDSPNLQGNIIDDQENQIVDVQKMLAGFLRALLDEQKGVRPAETPEGNP